MFTIQEIKLNIQQVFNSSPFLSIYVSAKFSNSSSSSCSILRESKLHPLISIDSPICTKPPCKLAVQFGIHGLSIFPKELEKNILPHMQNAQKTPIREKKSTFLTIFSDSPSSSERRGQIASSRLVEKEASLHIKLLLPKL